MRQRLILASNNAGKLREFAELLQPFSIDVIAQGVLKIPAADEPFDSFVDNALAKARHASQLSSLPALADDSGICVDALAGAPGVRSARFAGTHCSDADNNQKLITALRDQKDRRAHYVCALVLVRNAGMVKSSMHLGVLMDLVMTLIFFSQILIRRLQNLVPSIRIKLVIVVKP